MTDKKSHQGGKMYGQAMNQKSKDLDSINEQFLRSGSYDDVENLAENLNKYKAQFIRFDLDCSGDIDLMELKMMMEKLDQPKTHREILAMMKDVSDTESIKYTDFLLMMLGGKNSVLRRILMFQEKSKEKLKPKGVAKKKSLADLGIRPEMAQHLG